jgi:hypothetical protein
MMVKEMLMSERTSPDVAVDESMTERLTVRSTVIDEQMDRL